MNRLVIIGILAALLPGVGEAKSYRDPKVRAEFQRLNPCPNKEWQIRPGTQGGRRGACPGWERDHATPICAGGSDTVENYQWLTKEQHALKTKIDVLRCRALERERRQKE